MADYKVTYILNSSTEKPEEMITASDDDAAIAQVRAKLKEPDLIIKVHSTSRQSISITPTSAIVHVVILPRNAPRAPVTASMPPGV